MTKGISGSLALAVFLCGCSTVTYTPNNSMAISKEKANEFVYDSSQAKNLDEYAKVLGYDKKDGYYTFSDKNPYNATSISWRTFASFCKAQGGIVDNPPRFTQTKNECPLPPFVLPNTNTHKTVATYCKVPLEGDTTKMGASKILYVYYSHFKGDYPKGEDRLDIVVTGEQSIIAPIKVCYDKAYQDTLVILEKERIKQEEDKAKKAELDKQKALEQERQVALAKQRAEEEKVQHAQRLKEIAAFRNGKLSEETVTNCGPILEVKKTMVKVYFPVKDYGNEHWIAKTEIFPDGYGCAFTNGKYVGPTYKY